MGGDIPVSDRVASWKQLSALSQVEAKVRERLVAGSHVEHLAANDVLWSS